MDIKDFKNILFAKAKDEGFSEYEIYYSERKSFSVNIYKEQIEKYQNSETSGFGFRGIYNGKMGYYYSETVDESIIPEVISEHFALQNVTCLASHRIYLSDSLSEQINCVNLWLVNKPSDLSFRFTKKTIYFSVYGL